MIFRDSLIQPIEYTHPVSLKKLSVDQRKLVFINELLPAILIVKFRLEQTFTEAAAILGKGKKHLKKNEKRFLDSLYVQYKTRNPDQLLSRLKTHPTSLVIAQAALETAWGTSRFFTESFNVFGTWSFDASEPGFPQRDCGKENRSI